MNWGIQFPMVTFSPGVIAAVFLAILLVFGTFSAVMLYLWRQYQVGAVSGLVTRIYFTGSGILIFLMAAAGLVLSL
jgi:hypothetical protein